MDVYSQKVLSCLPLCREELFTEVVCKKAYGNISQIWQIPGHILITTDEDKKLFTFDCKPISYHHVFDSGFLDISSLSSPLVNVLMLSDESVALVDTCGHVAIWTYSKDLSWSQTGSIELCPSTTAEVVNAAYLPGISCIVWCEKRHAPISSSSSSSPTYCVCKKQVLSGSTSGSSSAVVHNCPPCNVFAMAGDVLFITTQHNPEQVTVHFIFDFVENQFSLYFGTKSLPFPLSTFHEAVDFQEAVLTSLSLIVKTEPGQGDLGVRSDISKGHIVLLNSTGQAEVYSCAAGTRQITRKIVKLSPAKDNSLNVDKRHWFLHKGYLGYLVDNTLHIFHLEDGSQVCHSKLEGVQPVDRFIESSSPAFLAWILSPDQLFSLQASETKSREMYSSADTLPEDHLLQTDSLRLVHLQELKMKGYDSDVASELEQLKEKWCNSKNVQHHSQISHIIEPYLDEYWRLENLSKPVLDSEKPVTESSNDSGDTLVEALMDSRHLSKTSRHSKLVWLSEVYPQELLDYLCQGITIDNEEVSVEEMKQWQSLLGFDGSDLMNFETVCRLLFKLYPEKLLNFVKCAESVSEHTIGVSAFVRKRHCLIYYKTACDCLPENQTSSSPQTAASVKAKLILASESENCVERALKHLLHYGLWSEAVDLVKSKASDEEMLPTYLHITTLALAQGGVLSDYVVDLFAIMPSWKSFLSFSRVATERPEIRQQQLSSSVSDVFCQGQNGVSLASVKPFLLELIKKMEQQ